MRMPVFWLNEHNPNFPPAQAAEADGLLAVSKDLSIERLIVAYQHGIFPWYSHRGLFYWYSPDPRLVLFPQELKVHKSMRSIFNQRKFEYTLDTAFEQVMRACATVQRSGQQGSWITEPFVRAYTQLHEQGLAHSVEVWRDGTLVGGLYGLSFGRVFFGESMFAQVPNASKAGFITLVRALGETGFRLIDCQQETAHLSSLGARPIPRAAFIELLEQNCAEPTLIGQWCFCEGRIEVCRPNNT